jgi:O-methyltransferase
VNSGYQTACLELLRRDLTRYGMRETTPEDWPLRRKLLLHTLNAGNAMMAGVGPFGKRKRELGLD